MDELKRRQKKLYKLPFGKRDLFTKPQSHNRTSTKLRARKIENKSETMKQLIIRQIKNPVLCIHKIHILSPNHKQEALLKIKAKKKQIFR